MSEQPHSEQKNIPVPKEGDKIQVITADETLEGTLMPQEQLFVVLKLASGYNIGIHKHRVREIRLLKAYEHSQIVAPTSPSAAGLPKISILHTGGTIASKVDYETGGVISRFTPEELLGMFPEIKQMASVTSRLVRQMWSEDIRFSHYNILAKEVAHEINAGAHAVIITHGTDTMHYTSAALAFMLQHTPVPVILVGAQRSSDRGGSDAALNLLSAITLVTTTNFADIAVCMHETTNDETCVILPATKCRKMHSSRRDAFKAVNTEPWAIVNPKTRQVRFCKTDYHHRTEQKENVRVRSFKEDIHVGILRMHTNMYAEEFSCYNSWEGLILEGSGMAGNMPINEIDEYTKEHTAIYNALQKLTKSGTVVCVTTQTIFGSINMNVYTTGRKMQAAGIIGNYCDMTTETAFIKLAWLLSNYNKQEVAELFVTNLVGEISLRLEAAQEK